MSNPVLDVFRLLCLPSVFLALYIGDIFTDALVAQSFSERDGYGGYALGTICIIIIPVIVFHAVCVIWMCSPKQDYWGFHSSNVFSKFFKILILFIFAPLIIQFKRLSAGWNFIFSKTSTKTKKDALSRHAENVDNVETFTGFAFLESCLQSAPQIVFQLIIMIRTGSIEALVLASCLVSLFSYGFNSTMYKTRQKNSHEHTGFWLLGVIVYLLYKVLTLVSRVISLALLFDIGLPEFIITLSFHLILMWAWFWILYTAQDKKKNWLSYAWSLFDALPLMFTYHNGGKNIRSKWLPHEQRWRMFIFYSIIIVENFACTYVWYNSGASVQQFQNMTELARNESIPITYNYTTDLYDVEWGSGSVTLSVLFTNLLAFGLGIGCMALYYKYLQPYEEVRKEEVEEEKEEEEEEREIFSEEDEPPKMSRYPLLFQKPVTFIKPPEPPNVDVEAPAEDDDGGGVQAISGGKRDTVTKMGQRGPLTELDIKTATELNKKDESVLLTKLTSREVRTVNDENSISTNALPGVKLSPGSTNHKDAEIMSNGSSSNKLNCKEEETVPLTTEANE